MDNTVAETPVQENSRQEGGKFLTFFLGKEEYGIEILKVREIIGLMDITCTLELVLRAPLDRN